MLTGQSGGRRAGLCTAARREIGQRICENVSKQAWQEWLAHQTMLINENRLNIRDPEARRFLSAEMEKHFFGGGSQKPAGFVAPE